MNYNDGQRIELGDRVNIGITGGKGTVVCIFESGEFTSEYPADEWSYLENGILVESEKLGLIHYEEPHMELQLLHRAV